VDDQGFSLNRFSLSVHFTRFLANFHTENGLFQLVRQRNLPVKTVQFSDAEQVHLRPFDVIYRRLLLMHFFQYCFQKISNNISNHSNRKQHE
jgi:hypothetical protein